MDFDRFAKVLALLESDNDGEALAAARSLRRMSARAGLRLHDIALAARDGLAGGDADELERMAEEARVLRREVRRLNFLLRNAGVQPSPPQGSPSPVRTEARYLLKLQKENKDLIGENERLLDMIDLLSYQNKQLEEEIKNITKYANNISSKLNLSEELNKILVEQSEDIINYLKS